jgi:hypothetical protein
VEFETMQAILFDIARGVAPADSKVKYTAELLAWRDKQAAEFEAWRVDHPDAILDVPTGLEGL